MTRRLRRALIPVTLAAATLTLAAPAASAHHPERVPLPTVYTLGEGHSLPCAGQVTSVLETPHDQPGVAWVTLSWTPFFTSPCTVTANISAWNNDTGWHGVTPVRLTNESSGLGAPVGRWTDRVRIPLGSGNSGLTVTTGTLSSFYFDRSWTALRFVVP
ncbi:hypothetical protein LCL87_08040 [Rhodococcus hoagii]|nr:hypothetical protein [Prescottella equi]